jgi:hypothetical protein
MLRRLRETGPGLLVPAAWLFVTLAHLDYVDEHTLFVAHVVMSVLLVAFLALSWDDMREGVLAVWRRVILLGTPATVAGTAGFLVDSGATALWTVAIAAWMLLPPVGFYYTARDVEAGAAANLAAGAIAALGFLLYAGTMVVDPGPIQSDHPLLVVGLALVGVGQTVGILDAVWRY